MKCNRIIAEYFHKFLKQTEIRHLCVTRCLSNTNFVQNAPITAPPDLLSVNVEQSIREARLIPKIKLDYAAKSSLIGRRSANEDRIVMEDLTPKTLLLAVIDGHGGSVVADFVQCFLTDCLRFWLRHRPEMSLCQALRHTFIDLNNSLARHFYYYYERKCLFSGSTLTAAVLRNSVDLAVAHVGDSLALLQRSGAPIRLTQQHEPGLAAERQRIRDAGGVITTNSLGVPIVNGRLGMTRSIGDFTLKRFGVIVQPDLTSLKISHSHDEFLLLVTDGVTFVLNDDELAQLVSNDCLDPGKAAKNVTDTALQFGSDDNVSALLLPFGSWGKSCSAAALATSALTSPSSSASAHAHTHAHAHGGDAISGSRDLNGREKSKGSVSSPSTSGAAAIEAAAAAAQDRINRHVFPRGLNSSSRLN